MSFNSCLCCWQLGATAEEQRGVAARCLQFCLCPFLSFCCTSYCAGFILFYLASPRVSIVVWRTVLLNANGEDLWGKRGCWECPGSAERFPFLWTRRPCRGAPRPALSSSAPAEAAAGRAELRPSPGPAAAESSVGAGGAPAVPAVIRPSVGAGAAGGAGQSRGEVPRFGRRRGRERRTCLTVSWPSPAERSFGDAVVRFVAVAGWTER